MSYLRDGIRIVVASEPRSYREALAGVLASSHPGISVITADPAEIHEMPETVEGALVLCNEVSSRVAEVAAGWIRLAPDGAVEVSSMADPEAMSRPSGLDSVVRAVDAVRTALAQVG
jgi:hypothetical protein